MKFTGGRLATGLLAIPSMNNNEFTVPGWWQFVTYIFREPVNGLYLIDLNLLWFDNTDVEDIIPTTSIASANLLRPIPYWCLTCRLNIYFQQLTRCYSIFSHSHFSQVGVLSSGSVHNNHLWGVIIATLLAVSWIIITIIIIIWLRWMAG